MVISAASTTSRAGIPLLRTGVPCDVLIVTDAMVAELVASGELRTGTRRPIGRVQTAIATRTDSPRPAIAAVDALRASLLDASALYFPDAVASTAGAHVARMLDRLGIGAEMAARDRTFVNGATAMRELVCAAERSRDRLHAGDRDRRDAGADLRRPFARAVRAGDGL